MILLANGQGAIQRDVQEVEFITVSPKRVAELVERASLLSRTQDAMVHIVDANNAWIALNSSRGVDKVCWDEVIEPAHGFASGQPRSTFAPALGFAGRWFVFKAELARLICDDEVKPGNPALDAESKHILELETAQWMRMRSVWRIEMERANRARSDPWTEADEQVEPGGEDGTALDRQE